MGKVLQIPIDSSKLPTNPKGSVGDTMNQYPFEIKDIPFKAYVYIKIGDKVLNKSIPIDQIKGYVDQLTQSDGMVSSQDLINKLQPALVDSQTPQVNFQKPRDDKIPADQLLQGFNGDHVPVKDLVDRLPGQVDSNVGDFFSNSMADYWPQPIDQSHYANALANMPENPKLEDGLRLVRAQGCQHDAADIISQKFKTIGNSDSSSSGGPLSTVTNLVGGSNGGGLIGGLVGGGSSGSGSSYSSSYSSSYRSNGSSGSSSSGGLVGGLLGK